MNAAALYVGRLRHRRRHPAVHEFTYSLFMALLDIDRIPEAMAVSWLSGYNRRRWLSFHERDYIGDPARPLRERVMASAREHGIDLPDGKIQLLTLLRYGGYAFNPISLFYCYDRSGRMQHVLADVRNTYGGRQTYWLTRVGGRDRTFRALAAKSLYVSPFMPSSVDYEFLLGRPDRSLVAHINVLPSGGQGAPIFDATLTLSRRPWTVRSLRTAVLQYPLMTAKVIGAIHWEALRLRLKRVPIVPIPSHT